jgi:hypothetical protein
MKTLTTLQKHTMYPTTRKTKFADLIAQSSFTKLGAYYAPNKGLHNTRYIIQPFIQRTAAIMLLLLSMWLMSGAEAQAQNNVGIGTTTPNSKAILELQATDKGLLVPRLTPAQMTSIVAPPNGLLVYNTTENCFNYYNTGTSTWKSMCSITGIGNSGDTVVINILKVDSLIAHYAKIDTALIKFLTSQYIKSDSAYIKWLRADSAYIKFLTSQYIRTDSIYAHLGKFDSLMVKGISIDSLIKQVTQNYLNHKDTLVLKYLRTDSIYTKLLKADSAFIKHLYAHTIKADTIIGHWGKFDSLYVGGKNIANIITDSIAAQAWLLKGNNVVGSNYKLGTLNNKDLFIIANNNKRITIISATGNVGIGQLLPSAKLDVIGDIKFDKELRPAGLPGTTGDVLVSQGLGIAPVWVSPSTIVPSTTVSNAYNSTTGNFVTTVNGVTSTAVTLPINKNLTDSITSLAWLLRGNTAIPGDYLGTNNNEDLVFKRNGVQSGLLTNQFSVANTSFGVGALKAGTAGTANSAFGTHSLFNIAAGNSNTSVGAWSLFNNTNGDRNTAVGQAALNSSTTGSNLTAIGNNAGFANTTGSNNTFLGTNSDATTGTFTNATAIGYNAKVGANNALVLGGTGVDAVNVGIGLTIPTSTLYIKGTTSVPNFTVTDFTNYTFDIIGDNLNRAVFNGLGTTQFQFRTSSLDRMMITATGNVGINTITPAQKLDVAGNIQLSQALMPAGNAGTTGQILTSAGANTAPTWVNANTLPTPANAWNILGNTGTNSALNFVGTADAQNLVFKRNSIIAGTLSDLNTSYGLNALNTLTPGSSNVAIGISSMEKNNNGSYNTATGTSSMGANVNTGGENAAYGAFSMWNNTGGSFNTAVGAGSLQVNVNGNNNSTLGQLSLPNGTGNNNTSVGFHSLISTTSADNNTALGYNAGLSNVTGANNTFIGSGTNAFLGNLTNATAIGYNTIVGASNSLILGNNLVNVGINTTTPANKLEVVQGTAGNSGLRLTSMPNAGVLSTNASGDVINNATPNPANGLFWGLTGNSGTVPATNFIGTTDAQDFVLRTTAIERMRILANGNVGINNTSPTTAKLMVNSTSNLFDGITASHTSSSITTAYHAVRGELNNSAYTIANGYLAYHNSTNATYGVYATGGNYAGVLLNKMYIGNVQPTLAIHTADLEVSNVTAGTAAANLTLRQSTALTTANADMGYLNFADNYLAAPQASIRATRDLASSGITDLPTRLTFHTTPDASATLTERMRITENGNVGIGTIAPAVKLHVTGDVFAQSATEPTSALLSDDGAVELYRANTATFSASTGGYIDLKAISTDDFRNRLYYNSLSNSFNIITSINGFPGGASERFTILNANGNVGINHIAPTQKLDVLGGAVFRNNPAVPTGNIWNGTSNIDAVDFGNSAGGNDYYVGIQRTGTGAPFHVAQGPAAAASGALAGFYRAGVLIGTISFPTVSSVAYNTTSDERLKENIKNTRFGINDVLKINVKDYNYKADATKQVLNGFIAQQLYTIYPEAVHKGGEDAKTSPWMVDYGKLTPLLVKGMQDQQVQIEALKNNASNTTNNAELKTIIEKQQAQIDALQKQNAEILLLLKKQ